MSGNNSDTCHRARALPNEPSGAAKERKQNRRKKKERERERKERKRERKRERERERKRERIDVGMRDGSETERREGVKLDEELSRFERGCLAFSRNFGSKGSLNLAILRVSFGFRGS